MQLVDTHAHIYLDAFDADRDALIQECKDQGLSHIYLPNIDQDSIKAVHALADSEPNMCLPMMGLHPCSVQENYQEVLDGMRPLFDQRTYAAVGEIGIDMHWDKSTLPIQEAAFRIQIEWAKEMGLPIIIHARESFDEIFKVVDELNDERLTGIFHCFTGTVAQAEHILGYGGFKLGIGGVLTFKNSGLDATVAQLDLKDLVLETDAPYLAPKPFRGKRNSPTYLTIIAEKLAEVKGVSVEEVARMTTRNAHAVFGKGSANFAST